jgi:hypothetical protein
MLKEDPKISPPQLNSVDVPASHKAMPVVGVVRVVGFVIHLEGHPHLLAFTSSFKMEYSYLVNEILYFTFTSPAFIMLSIISLSQQWAHKRFFFYTLLSAGVEARAHDTGGPPHGHQAVGGHMREMGRDGPTGLLPSTIASPIQLGVLVDSSPSSRLRLPRRAGPK